MKRKIKDFKDFLECIKAGKKVTGNDGKWLYYFENGYICNKNKDGFVWYNTGVDTEDLSRMEVEEQEPLKIEAGKFYKTRKGEKAYCFRFETETDLTNSIYSYVIDNRGIITTNSEGKHYSDKNYDIVGCWEEK